MSRKRQPARMHLRCDQTGLWADECGCMWCSAAEPELALLGDPKPLNPAAEAELEATLKACLGD